MPTKSLVEICQGVIGKHLDALYELGDTPFRLLEAPLKRATAQQLYRIEKCNPHILEETQDLWITHCLTFRDIRISYEAGNVPLDTNWRETYLERHEENQRKRQLIGAKIKSHYNQIQNEKEARSTKFITKAIVPSKRRVEHNSNCNSKRTKGSSLFAKTMQAARQEAAIYHSHDIRRSTLIAPRHVNTPTVIQMEKPPSTLQKSYSSLPYKQPTQIKPPPVLKPPPPPPPPPPPLKAPAGHVIQPSISKKATKDQSQTKYYNPSRSASKTDNLPKWPADKKLEKVSMEELNTKPKNPKGAKDSAIVNFGIFKELSGH